MTDIIKEENIDIVRFQSDRINAFNVEKIKAQVLPLLEVEHNKTIIDLNGIDYIDSTGFAMFLLFRRVARTNYSTIKFCGMSESVKELFKTLNLNSFFDIYHDTQSCLQSF